MSRWLILLGLADMVFAGASFGGGFHAGLALLVHLGLSLAALTIWWRSGLDRRFALLTGLALGPIGIVLALLAPPIGKLTRRWRFLEAKAPGDDDGRLEGFAAHAAPEQGGALVARLLDGRVRHPDPGSLGSLITVMRHGGLDDRREALETAVRSFDPQLSTVVAKALTDADQTIRALAAAASNRLTQRLAEDRQALQEAIAAGDHRGAARLRTRLIDHSRFDVLLSETVRAQIAREADVATPDAAGGTRDEWPDDRADDWVAAADEKGRQLVLLSHYWQTRNFAMMDALCHKALQTQSLRPDPMWSAVQWWAAEPCS